MHISDIALVFSIYISIIALKKKTIQSKENILAKYLYKSLTKGGKEAQHH